MNKSFLVVTFGMLLLAACNQGQIGTQSVSDQPDRFADASFDADSTPVAVCLWEGVGLRGEPGMNKNIEYITTILLGEQVMMLGEEVYVEKEKRSYIKVRLSDGQEGWVYQYLFGINARLGAVNQTTNIFRRPDPMMLKAQKFEQGEILAILEEKDGWLKVAGRQKRKVGWIQQQKHISVNQKDVEVAVLYQKALLEKSVKNKINLLNAIIENDAYSDSDFIKLVQEDLNKSSQQLNAKALPADQLKITAEQAEVRKSPVIDAGNILVRLEEGTICTILNSNLPASVDTGNMKEIWFEVEYEGTQGWVYGQQTSKMLASQ